MNPFASGEYTARTALPPPLPPPPPLDIDFNSNHLEISNEADDFDHDDDSNHHDDDKKILLPSSLPTGNTDLVSIKQTDASQPNTTGKMCQWHCDLCKGGAPASVKKHTPPTWVMVCRTALALITNSEVAKKENRKFFHFKKELCKFIDEHADSLCLRERSTTWQNTVNMTLSHPSYKDIFLSGQSEILMPGYYGLKEPYDPYSDAADQWAQSQLIRKQRAPGGSKRKAAEVTSPSENTKGELSPTNSSQSVVPSSAPTKKILKAMPPSLQFHMQVPLSSPGHNNSPTSSSSTPVPQPFLNSSFSQGSSNQSFSYEDDSEDNEANAKSDDPNSPSALSSKEKKQHRLTTNLEKQLLEDFYINQVKARHNKLRSDSEPFLALVARLGWDPRRVRTWVENRKIKDKRSKDKGSDFKDFDNDEDMPFSDAPIDLTSQQATSQQRNNGSHKKPKLDESISSDSEEEELDLTGKQAQARAVAITKAPVSSEVQFNQETLQYERQVNERTKKQLSIAEDMISELQALNSLLRTRNTKLEDKLAESLTNNKKLTKQVETLEKLTSLTEDQSKIPEPNYEKFNQLVQQYKEQKGEDVAPSPLRPNPITRVPSTSNLPPASPVNVPPPVQTPTPSAPSPTPSAMAQAQTLAHRGSPVPQVVHLASLTPQQAQQYRISNLMNQAPVHHAYAGLPMGVAPPFPLGMPMHPLHQLTPPQSHQGQE